jgi:hypothetical protein
MTKIPQFELSLTILESAGPYSRMLIDSHHFTWFHVNALHQCQTTLCSTSANTWDGTHPPGERFRLLHQRVASNARLDVAPKQIVTFLYYPLQFFTVPYSYLTGPLVHSAYSLS